MGVLGIDAMSIITPSFRLLQQRTTRNLDAEQLLGHPLTQTNSPTFASCLSNAGKPSPNVRLWQCIPWQDVHHDYCFKCYEVILRHMLDVAPTLLMKCPHVKSVRGLRHRPPMTLYKGMNTRVLPQAATRRSPAQLSDNINTSGIHSQASSRK